MKKLFAILLLAVCGMTGVFAQSESDFWVNEADGAVTITKYTGKATAVTIPGTIGGKPVVEIGSYAFSRTSIIGVRIPASVTYIGNFAFYGCTGLTTVSIPARVTGVGDAAFSGCTGLRAVTIPASVTIVGVNAFGGCTALTTIRIGANVARGRRDDAFPGKFDAYYTTHGKKAGVYTLRKGKWSWAAQ